jgi:hypothetical protein
MVLVKPNSIHLSSEIITQGLQTPTTIVITTLNAPIPLPQRMPSHTPIPHLCQILLTKQKGSLYKFGKQAFVG